MKNAVTVALLVLMTGCSSLLPARVEHFQKKVRPVPVLADQPKLVEAQKQAAQFVDQKVAEAQTAAAATSADVSVQTPLAEAKTVSGPLVTSMGPPAASWTGPAPKLATVVLHETSILDKKIDTYAKRVEPMEGKKIEGTGLIQMGFFTQWALVLGVLALGWVALKVYGAFNPVAGLASNVVGRVSSKVLHAGFHQVVEGGEKFKELAKSANKALTYDEIKALYRQAQETTQDRSVQGLVKQLTS